MIVQMSLENGGKATLESGDDLADLSAQLTFLLTVLHTLGFDYVHQLIALKSTADSCSATGERYKITQSYSSEPKPEAQMLISVQRLVELQNDVNFYKEEAESYKAIRNRMAAEVNSFYAERDLPNKYEITEED